MNVTKSTTLNVNLANIYEKSFGPGFGDNDNDIWSYTFNASPNAFRYSIPMVLCPVRLPTPATIRGICWYTQVIVNNFGIRLNL